jgi:hypothetical protein
MPDNQLAACLDERTDELPTTHRQLMRFSLALPPSMALRVFSRSLNIGWANARCMILPPNAGASHLT